jgi:hypothetical protein
MIIKWQRKVPKQEGWYWAAYVNGWGADDDPVIQIEALQVIKQGEAFYPVIEGHFGSGTYFEGWWWPTPMKPPPKFDKKIREAERYR